jgi:ABC-type phosphate transport system substrate-binding protein
MKNISLRIAICLLATAFFGFTNAPTPFAESIVVIVNKDNPIEKLTAGEAKLYYTRKIKKRWPGIEKNIRPADRKNKCLERDAFYSGVLGMKDIDVEEYFLNKQLQNAERPPDKFASESDLISFVADEPGAIGYIRASSVTADVKARVKIVFTL